ncbi:TIGR03899 family protein [Shewanella sp. 202IG2-18]|nr:TIGR03899 family protein [Parashewanella hymeniacidonis]
MRVEKKITTSSANSNDVSARRKALNLGGQLGLVADGDYKPANASVAARGEHRQRKLIANYQKNLESIYQLALDHTPSDVTGIDLDPDWLYHFFEMAEKIHNPKMQDLWARILAREIVKPGNFTIETLDTLKKLTQREALILERALGLGSTFNNETRLKLLSRYRVTGGWTTYFRNNPIRLIDLSKCGLPYSSILTMIHAGILHPEEFETGRLTKGEEIKVTYPHKQLSLIPKIPHIVVGYYRFTNIGNELAQLVSPKLESNVFEVIRSTLNDDFVIQ